MNEKLVEEVLAEVRRRQHAGRPAALLIGDAPNKDYGWDYVREGDYCAVLIGSITAAQLLRFPDEVSMQALLEGKPVFLAEEGLLYRRFSHTANRALWSRLLSAERNMKQLGVQFLRAEHPRLLTAEEVRRRLKEGLPIEGRLTPLARDLLEGKQ